MKNNEMLNCLGKLLKANQHVTLPEKLLLPILRLSEELVLFDISRNATHCFSQGGGQV